MSANNQLDGNDYRLTRGFFFWGCAWATLWLVLFWGEPDLLDAIIARVMP